MKTYNLKQEFNWRGDVAELLAKYRHKAKRTKGYDFQKDPGLSTKDNAFLKRIWKCIDLYSCDDSGQLMIYEVKARNPGLTRKLDITEITLNAYREALARKITVYLVIVTFHDNWEVSFSIEDFDETRFRVNNGGYYRRFDKSVA